MLNINERGFKWIHQIHSILTETDRPDIWLRQFNSVHVPLTTSKLIKQILLDQFNQNWNGLLQNASKGNNYALFKDNVNEAKYISILSCPTSRTMRKFRTGDHKLPIEVGR